MDLETLEIIACLSLSASVMSSIALCIFCNRQKQRDRIQIETLDNVVGHLNRINPERNYLDYNETILVEETRL